MPGIEGTFSRLLLVCCLTSACGGGGSSTISISEPLKGEPLPVLAELEAIESPSLIAFPSYSFSSTMPGQIVVGGSCSSLDTQAVEGSNTIRMNNLAPGDYLDCTIRVRNNEGNLSDALLVSNFTIAVPEAIAFTALVGEQDSVVTFEPTAEGFDFYTSAEINCDLDNYTSCDAAELTILNNEPVTISTLQHNRTAYFSLQKSNIRSQELAVSIKDKNSRLGKQNVVFNGQVWEVGGLADDGQMLNDVWSITDGKYWAEHTSSAEFSARYDHQLKVFNGEMWLVGGLSVDGLENDVWRSPDGVNWDLATASAEFSPRRGHQLVVFDKRLWVIGGEDSTGKLADIWSSENGTTWRLESASGPYGPRVWHTVIEHAGQLYIAGGEGIEEQSIWQSAFPMATNFNNGWWRSSNGVDWELIDENRFSNSKYVALVVAGGKLREAGSKIINDSSPPIRDDVVSTWDGNQWLVPNTNYFLNMVAGRNIALEFNGELWLLGLNIRMTSEKSEYDTHVQLGPYYSRQLQGIAKYDNQIWVFGGTSCCSSGDGTNHFEVWSSYDGIEWTGRHSLQVRLGGRSTGIEFDNKLWAFAGNSATPGLPVSGWTNDGQDWTEIDLPYEYNVTRFDPIVFNNRLWIIGGYEAYLRSSIERNKDQIWSMEADGDWQLAAQGIEGFLPRVDYEAVVFNGQMLVYGGLNIVTNQAWRDVWSSDNGADWVQRADNMPFLSDPFDSDRIANELEITVHNDLLWFVGRSGVWNSSDGINWVQVRADLPFTLNGSRMLTSHNGMLAHVAYHTWYSVDGVTWRRGVNGSLQLAD